jgi:hypothetical protein
MAAFATRRVVELAGNAPGARFGRIARGVLTAAMVSWSPQKALSAIFPMPVEARGALAE